MLCDAQVHPDQWTERNGNGQAPARPRAPTGGSTATVILTRTRRAIRHDPMRVVSIGSRVCRPVITGVRDMRPVSTEARHHDPTTIFFHWATAVLIVTQWSGAQTVDGFPSGPPRVDARSRPHRSGYPAGGAPGRAGLLAPDPGPPVATGSAEPVNAARYHGIPDVIGVASAARWGDQGGRPMDALRLDRRGPPGGTSERLDTNSW